MKKYSCAVVTRTGRRHNNQDNFMLSGKYAELDHDVDSAVCSGATSSPLFAVVADGMGGESAGERASFEACRYFAKVNGLMSKDLGSNKRQIADAIVRTNDQLCAIMNKEQIVRMGCTVAAVLLQADTLYYTNLGDSRIYMLRKGQLWQLTHDHTEGQSMVEAGILSEEQLKTHPSRHKLNLHLGIFPNEVTVSAVEYEDVKLQNGDKLLLCSDGVSDSVSKEEMIAILSGAGSAQERANMLADAASANGSNDNMTALVIDVSGSSAILPIAIAAGAVVAAAACALLLPSLLKGKAGQTAPEPTPEPNEIAVSPTPEVTEEPMTEAPATEAAPTEDVSTDETSDPSASEAAGSEDPTAPAGSEDAGEGDVSGSEPANSTEGAQQGGA